MAEIIKKSISELNFPVDLSYYREHTWAQPKGEFIQVGISDYAQDQLGDVIFVELPRVGEHFRQGESFGIVESAKSVSTLYMPVSGEIMAVNDELDSSAEIINQRPYSNGWIAIVKPADSANALAGLLTSEEYKNLLGGK